MDRLLSEQEDVINSIGRTVTNFKKIGQKNFTSSSTRNRLSILQQLWSRCQQLHAEIKVMTPTQERSKQSYFVDDHFSTTEQEYYDASDYLCEILEKLTQPIASPQSNINSSHTSDCHSISTSLPRIELFKFTGLYTEWPNFRDLFESLVANNENLINVQRLYYLKPSLSGAAQLVVKNITVTDSNYKVAWSALKRRYENLRAIVSSHINNILDATPMKSDWAPELKRVHDSISDSLAALRSMERASIDDFIVTTTARKLDTRTRKDWEISLGSSYDPPTFSILSDFLISRIVALDAANDNTDNQNRSNRSGNTKSLATNISNAKCLLCNEIHSL